MNDVTVVSATAGHDSHSEYEVEVEKHRTEMKKLLGDEAGWLEDGPVLKKQADREDEAMCWGDQEVYWEDMDRLVERFMKSYNCVLP